MVLAGCVGAGNEFFPVCEQGEPIDCDRGALDSYHIHLHDVEAAWNPSTMEVVVTFSLSNFGNEARTLDTLSTDIRGIPSQGPVSGSSRYGHYVPMGPGESHRWSVTGPFRNGSPERIGLDIFWEDIGGSGSAHYVDECLVLEGTRYVQATKETHRDLYPRCDHSQFYDAGQGPLRWFGGASIVWSESRISHFPPPMDDDFWSQVCPRCYGQWPPLKVVWQGPVERDA